MVIRFQLTDLAANRTWLTVESVRIQNISTHTLLTNLVSKSTCELLRRIGNLAHIPTTIQHIANPTTHTHRLLHAHDTLLLAALKIWWTGQALVGSGAG